jgi:hypothetical protein
VLRDTAGYVQACGWESVTGATYLAELGDQALRNDIGNFGERAFQRCLDFVGLLKEFYEGLKVI